MFTRRSYHIVALLVLGVAGFLQGCSGNPVVLTQPPVSSTGAPRLAGTVVQRGTVVLPSGSSLVPNTLTVKNSLGLTVPAKDGSFSVNQFAGGPQFAFVTDPAGEAILAGFVGPQSTTIDAQSTAKVFIYWSAGFFTLPSPYRAQVVDAIASQPGFGAVQSAFEDDLRANPDPFSRAMGRANVVTAIAAFTQSLYSSSAASTPLTRTLRKLGARRPSAVTLNPGTPQSGIMATGDQPGGVHFTNTYRRAAEAFIDEDSYVDASGNRVAKHVVDVAAPMRIPAVSGINGVTGGAINVALSLLGGATQYAPLSTSSLALASEPNSQSTRYTITIVGAGKPNSAVALTQEQSDQQKSVVIEQLAQDYLIPLVASIAIPINSSAIDDYLATGGSASLASIATATDSIAPQLYPVADSGQVGDALVLGMNALAADPTLQSQLLQLVGDLISNTAGSAAGAAFQNGFSPLYALNVLSAVVLSADTAVASANIAASNEADVFVVDVAGGTVTVSPAAAAVLNGGTRTFTVTAPSAAAGQSLVYDWTNTAAFGHTTDGTTGHTDNFESSSATITYTANATGIGNDTIGVTAFAVSGQNRTQVGSPATATARAGVCPFAGTFSGPITDGRTTPPTVSTIVVTVTCSPPNNVHISFTDPTYGSGAYDGTFSGFTVTAANGTVTDVYSSDYNTINGSEPNALQTDVLTRTSGP